MITKTNKIYLQDNMCIEIKHFCKKMKIYTEYTDFINELLDTLFLLDIPTNYYNTDKPWETHYEKIITESWYKINNRYKIKESSEMYKISDTIRDIFYTYKRLGLHGLYKYRETEDWYPIVKINKIIEPNNIDTLGDRITVYRGTRENEYNSGKFSQSWTLDINIARWFPIKNTAGKIYSDKKIILKTIVNKKDIFYFSSKDIMEQEVIVNSDNIIKNKVKIVG